MDLLTEVGRPGSKTKPGKSHFASAKDVLKYFKGANKMKNKSFLRFLSVVVCIVLIAAMGLVLTSCGDDTATASSSNLSSVEEKPIEATDGYGPAAEDLGNGKVPFIFRVTDKDGYDHLYRIHTDKKTVGEALMEHALLEGEDSEYGLYVKKVNGQEADYSKDQSYWAFYINNEYAMTGVDKTDVTANMEYWFKYTKDE